MNKSKILKTFYNRCLKDYLRPVFKTNKKVVTKKDLQKTKTKYENWLEDESDIQWQHYSGQDDK